MVAVWAPFRFTYLLEALSASQGHMLGGSAYQDQSVRLQTLAIPPWDNSERLP